MLAHCLIDDICLPVFENIYNLITVLLCLCLYVFIFFLNLFLIFFGNKNHHFPGSSVLYVRGILLFMEVMFL